MKASINIPLACALGILVSACGGGGGTTASPTQPTALSTYAVVGKVPGTLIEAFCSDGGYYSVTSTNDGTAQHPFTLNLPQGVSCRLVMTTNENDPVNRVVTPIRLKKGATGTLAFTSGGGGVNLDYVDLAMSRVSMRADSNSDGVEDSPLDVDISGAATDVELDDAVVDPMDIDRDGIIDVYEDDDHDGQPNRYDDDDDGDNIPDWDDRDHDNDGRDDGDSDHDGIHDDDDVDDDNDGRHDGNSGSGTTLGGSTGTGVTAPDGARLLAAQCFQCHGTEGRSVSGIDGLAGEAGEIASEMQEMKYSTNTNDIMHKQAMGYTDAQIQAIAAYFTSVYGNAGGEGDDDDD